MSRFIRCELRRLLTTRAAYLVMGAMAYALLAFPVVVKQPPPELRGALTAWFGAEHLELRLLLFAWFDLIMNKLAIFAAAILAAGVVTDERSKQTLDLYLSKPITLQRYWLAKALAAAAATAVLYLVLTALATLYFSLTLAAFSLRPFLLMSVVHLFCAMFASAFAALMAVSFKHKLSAMLATVGVLSVAVGLAFAGFYQPAWASLAALNPMTQGVALVATAERAAITAVLSPIAALATMSAAVLATGALLTRRQEAQP